MASPWNIGDLVGPWTLVESLGGGGNGIVYKASHPSGQLVALKILRPQFHSAENTRYKRFRDEIRALRELGSHPGILPLVDAYLPETPSAQDPPWLATELAVELRKALGPTAKLRNVVEAIFAIADCLASLHARGYSHRDVKPNNLYSFRGNWAIGDFGLVEFPDKEALTASGEKVGPANFIAPEMLLDAKVADGAKADVYSLAKTLWVLGTGQNVPPPGEQPAYYKAQSVGAYVQHPKTVYLDRLIERASRLNPSERITMAELAEELRAWLAEPTEPQASADVSQLAKRIIDLMEQPRRAEERHQEYIKQGEASLQRLAEQLRPFAESMGRAAQSEGRIKIHQNNVSNVVPFPETLPSGARRIWRNGVCTWIYSPGSNPVRFWAGIEIYIYEDGRFIATAAHVFKSEPSNAFAKTWSATCEGWVGSAHQEQQLDSLLEGLQTNLPSALEGFAELLEKRQ